MDTRWLTREQVAAWVRLAAVLELLPTALDSQLRRDAQLTHFDYYVLALLSEAPQRTMRMAKLAQSTTATLARLSHVVQRLEGRGLLDRVPCPTDRRATNARLTEAGWQKVQQAAPGHVTFVRDHVIDALTPDQVIQLADITQAILHRLDPDAGRADTNRLHDSPD
ncbi:MarR family winged helix-turn-helix transcriptional regulator [Streptomyces acidiscabies]|uniref:MarR family winged helix-turn-helix transcriptional regulator n=1 Tax=Streptomyces acidiscabies TaxID=42234 RepID=UPI0009516407|nr:MarR family transcriptional regulator [Streptomyces acidiscabies]